ncbi:MAG: UPF0280 family protein [Methanobrevibacter sp.]|jgi:ApbE superfamily uncharacterized protein (UPF0280 family)|nr:UPF0280 family protein [Candidatus Methanoflexus mossambicus]
MFNKTINIDETILKIKTDINIDNIYDNIYNSIFNWRNNIKNYSKTHPNFLKSHKPLNFHKSLNFQKGSKIIEKMHYASEIAEIGPMGAVAGTISQFTLENLLNEGLNYSIVNNGGDLAFFNNNEDKNIICGIYAGSSEISGKIAFKFSPSDKQYGLCTSSGTVGYSFSYGRADAVSIIAQEASIADTLATSIANEVKGNDDKIAIEQGLKQAKKFKKYFIGGIIIVNNQIGTIGKLPEIISLDDGNLDEYIQDTIL